MTKINNFLNKIRNTIFPSSKPSSINHTVRATGKRISENKTLASANATSESPSIPLFEAPIKKRPQTLTKFSCNTPMFACSARKLNLLGRQISRLPLPAAIIQMKFSDKRAGKTILSTLQNAFGRIKVNASEDNRDRFVILAAMVGRGPYIEKVEPKARGRMGIQRKPHSFLRMEIGIPDPLKIAKKQLKVKNKYQRERRNVYINLDY